MQVQVPTQLQVIVIIYHSREYAAVRLSIGRRIFINGRCEVHPLEQAEDVDLDKGAEGNVDDPHVGRQVEEVDDLGRHPEQQTQHQRGDQLRPTQDVYEL